MCLSIPTLELAARLGGLSAFRNLELPLRVDGLGAPEMCVYVYVGVLITIQF